VRRVMLLAVLLLAGTTFAQEVRYLILAKSIYRSTLQPLADWKTRKGVPSGILTDSDLVWTVDSLRSCIRHHYSYHGTRFVLLVGLSPTDIPYHGIYNDRVYSDVDDDSLDEIWLGRLPCRKGSVDTCAVMVDKILRYEQNPDSGDWFTSATTIRLEEEDPDRYYRRDIDAVTTLLRLRGYVQVDPFFGVDTDQESQSGALEDSLSSGRSLVLFRGPSTVQWYFPFTVNPDSVQCGYRLPVIVSGSCQTVELCETQASLANSFRFLAAGTQGAPRGAVGYFGTTRTDDGISKYRSIVSRKFFTALLDHDSTLGGAAAYAKSVLWDSMLHGSPPMDTTRYWE
jgi:hypothetical protein